MAALFEPVKAGGPAGFGWFVEAISPSIDGAVFLNLVHESGATARVRVCRRDGQPVGVAHTDRLDFVIMRRSGPTEETLGRAVLAIAAAGANNQRGSAVLGLLKSHTDHLAACRV
jgi:hypothetical protein